ncbi:MAG: ROK family protein [Protaetiibacter sp.]
MNPPRRSVAQRARGGVNLPAIGDYNERLVLDVIRRASDPTTRVEIIELTGLSPQTVSNITRTLIGKGTIREGEKQRHGGQGKPRTTLELESRSGYAIGVHVDPVQITYTLVDLVGVPLLVRSEATAEIDDPLATVDRIEAQTRELVNDAGIEWSRVLGVGIATPGPIDAVAGTVLDPPFLPRWRNVPLTSELTARLGMPVLLDKDVVACALAEAWRVGDSTTQNLAYIYASTGIGIGMIADGGAVRGATGNAGDIGMLWVGGLDGRPPRPFSSALSPSDICEHAQRRGLLGGREVHTHPRIARAALAELVELADAGDRIALDLLKEASEYLAAGIATIANLLDVDDIYLGGFVGDVLALRYLEEICEFVDVSAVASHLEHPVTVRTSSLGVNAGAIGAATIVLDDRLSPRPSTLSVEVPAT